MSLPASRDDHIFRGGLPPAATASPVDPLIRLRRASCDVTEPASGESRPWLIETPIPISHHGWGLGRGTPEGAGSIRVSTSVSVLARCAGTATAYAVLALPGDRISIVTPIM